MKFFGKVFFAVLAGAMVLTGGCVSDKLPSEDIEALEKFKDTIAVLKSDKFSADSREKYEAACLLESVVDFYYTRELKTVNEFFNYRDMLVDDPSKDSPVFSFNYRYKDKYIRFRFFSHKMFVTRVEITRK